MNKSRKEYEEYINSINAPEDLKERTKKIMMEKMQNSENNEGVQNDPKNKNSRKKTGKIVIFKRIMTVAATVVLVAGCTGLYTVRTEAAYITYESDEVIGLSVNRWNRVISVDALNEAGEQALEHLDLKHKNYDDAVDCILDYELKNGKNGANKDFCVSVKCDDSERIQQMKNNIDERCENKQFKMRDSQDGQVNSNHYHNGQENGNQYYDGQEKGDQLNDNHGAGEKNQNNGKEQFKNNGKNGKMNAQTDQGIN